MTRRGRRYDLARLAPAFVIAGTGMGLFFAPIANVVLSAVRPNGPRRKARRRVPRMPSERSVACSVSRYWPPSSVPTATTAREPPASTAPDRRSGRGADRGTRCGLPQWPCPAEAAPTSSSARRTASRSSPTGGRSPRRLARRYDQRSSGDERHRSRAVEFHADHVWRRRWPAMAGGSGGPEPSSTTSRRPPGTSTWLVVMRPPWCWSVGSVAGPRARRPSPR